MDAADALAGVTSVWAVAMAVSPVMQIRAMLRRRSSLNVSVGYFVVLLIGFCLWAVYGVSIDNMVLTVPNTIAALFAAATIAVAIWLRD